MQIIGSLGNVASNNPETNYPANKKL